MRAAGGYPDYPLPPAAARARLAVLDARVARLEAALAHRPAAELWAERDGWAEERDALARALATLEVVPALPRCGCGKATHPDPASAERHAEAIRLVSARREKRGLSVAVYGDCPARRHPGWHVGHRRGDRAAREIPCTAS